MPAPTPSFRELAIRGLLPVALLLAAPTAAASTNFVVWTSPSEGSGGGISATVDSTVTAGNLIAASLDATDPSFVAEFAASYSALRYEAGGSPASIESTLSFSPALPQGAKLLAVDLDFMNEAFTLSSGGTPLSLLEQRESTDGASSTFPSYDAGTGVLSTTAPSPNEFEASVFDVSGLSTIDVDFANGMSSAGFIAIAVPPAVPTLGLAGRLMLVLGLMAVARMALRGRRPALLRPRRFRSRLRFQRRR